MFFFQFKYSYSRNLINNDVVINYFLDESGLILFYF